MAHPLVQYGSKGKDVEELQELLNKWSQKEYGPTGPYCKPDGDFGPNTRDTVKSFQVNNFLYKDGKVGSNTWSALLGTETINSFDLPLPFVAAPNQYQCWAGATAMLLRRHTPVTTQPAGVVFETLPGGGVGGLNNSHANMKKFADAHNMQMYKGENISLSQLANMVHLFGRMMLNMKGVNSNLANGSPDDSHLLILAGARGSGSPGSTTITLYNPSAGNSGGRVITHSYQYFKSQYPKMTYQIFYTHSNSSSRIY